MNRKKFVELVTGCTGAVVATPFIEFSEKLLIVKKESVRPKNESGLSADVVICGGGLGGCAAALSALRNNLSVILTEETDWIGGQLSQQGVPPDEHQWIETHGCTKLYRDFRTLVRQYYTRNYPLTEQAAQNKYLNPGDGSVSRLCHEPRVAVAVLSDLLAPYISSNKLKLLTEYKISAADVEGDHVRSVSAVSRISGNSIILSAPYFIDATEFGDLLPLTKTEFVTGSESRMDTGELHAPDKADPENNQSFTMCFAMDYIPGENHTIDKPVNYDFWKNYNPDVTPPWSGRLLNLSYSNPSTLVPKELGFHPEGLDTSPLLNLWNYRRIISRKNFKPGTFQSDITLVNWPQNDYMLGNLIGASQQDFKKHVEGAKQLSLSLLYWLQTEAPGPDKGYGWSGLRLRNDIMGTEDGLAKYPYIRESRRIKAMFTVKEEHVGKENRSLLSDKSKEIVAADFFDSVGIGYYHIDLHPSNKGNNYIDFPSLPFQIPLGALIPRRVENLIAANKNIGTTHITNGCYRLHPVEWSIGEAAGLLAAFSLSKKMHPRVVRQRASLLKEFQSLIRSNGIETQWPKS